MYETNYNVRSNHVKRQKCFYWILMATLAGVVSSSLTLPPSCLFKNSGPDVLKLVADVMYSALKTLHLLSRCSRLESHFACHLYSPLSSLRGHLREDHANNWRRVSGGWLFIPGGFIEVTSFATVSLCGKEVCMQHRWDSQEQQWRLSLKMKNAYNIDLNIL